MIDDCLCNIEEGTSLRDMIYIDRENNRDNCSFDEYVNIGIEGVDNARIMIMSDSSIPISSTDNYQSIHDHPQWNTLKKIVDRQWNDITRGDLRVISEMDKIYARYCYKNIDISIGNNVSRITSYHCEEYVGFLLQWLNETRDLIKVEVSFYFGFFSVSEDDYQIQCVDATAGHYIGWRQCSYKVSDNGSTSVF